LDYLKSRAGTAQSHKSVIQEIAESIVNRREELKEAARQIEAQRKEEEKETIRAQQEALQQRLQELENQ
jgi:ubiquinone biosynthesis protein UbiJ